MVKKKTLVNNSISGVILLVITALLTFLCIPVFINKLGTELYGVFALVTVIGNLNIFTNIGLDAALTKFITEQGQSEDSNKDIITSLLLSSSLVILISSLVFCFRFFLLREILHIPEMYVAQAENLMDLLLIANGILLIGQTFTSMLHSLQRIYLGNILQLIYSSIYWIGTIIVVSMGYGLPAVGIMMLIAAIIWLLLSICYSILYWGNIGVDYSSNDFKKHANKQIVFGLKVYTSGIISFFNEPLFKIIISHFFGMSVVAYYEIAIKVKNQINGIFHKMIIPLYPYISQLTDKNFIATLIKDLTKKIFLLTIPVCLMLLFTCHDIVTLWLQTNITYYSYFIIGIAVPFLLFSPPTIPIYLFLLAKGHPEKTIVFQSFTVIANMLLFISLYPFIGLYSILAANALECLGSFLLGVYYQYKYQRITYRIPRITEVRRYAILLGVYLCIGGTGYFITNSYLALSYNICLLLISTIYLYKYLSIIRKEDVDRYFSENRFIVSLYNKL